MHSVNPTKESRGSSPAFPEASRLCAPALAVDAIPFDPINKHSPRAGCRQPHQARGAAALPHLLLLLSFLPFPLPSRRPLQRPVHPDVVVTLPWPLRPQASRPSRHHCPRGSDREAGLLGPRFAGGPLRHPSRAI